MAQSEGRGPTAELDEDLRRRIEESMPSRLETYGLSRADFPTLPSLVVDRPMTLTLRGKRIAEPNTVRRLKIRDYNDLKEIFGTPYIVCERVGMPEERMTEAERLIAELERPQTGVVERSVAGKLRRLAEIYLFLDNGKYGNKILPHLEGWRKDITVALWPFYDLIVQPDQTLTISSDVQIVWVNRLVMHAGSRIVAQGALRVDAFRMECY